MASGRFEVYDAVAGNLSMLRLGQPRSKAGTRGTAQNNFTFSTGEVSGRKLLVHDDVLVRLGVQNARFEA